MMIRIRGLNISLGVDTMPVVPKHLGSAVIPTGGIPVYTVPLNVLSATIRTITVVNLTASPIDVTLWLVPDGDTPDDSNTIAKMYPLGPRGILQDDGIHVLETGGSVVADCSSNLGMSVVVDGAELT